MVVAQYIFVQSVSPPPKRTSSNQPLFGRQTLPSSVSEVPGFGIGSRPSKSKIPALEFAIKSAVGRWGTWPVLYPIRVLVAIHGSLLTNGVGSWVL